MLSPDARCLAYVSNESGGYQVYVQPFPGPGRKSQVSTEGVTEPVWARSGRELFYRSGRKMMVVDTVTGPAFSTGNPKMLFEGDDAALGRVFGGQNYAVTPDGQHFIMIRSKEAAAAGNNPFMSRNERQIDAY